MRIVVASLSLFLAAACSGNVSGGGLGGDDDDDGPRPDGGPGEFDPPPDQPLCDETVPIPVTQTQKTPDVLLVVDKSGSMNEPLAGANATKMDVMKQAMSIVLPAENDNIRFGLSLYPSSGDCGTGIINAPVNAGNAGNVVLQINSVQPAGATPTHLALDAAGAYYAGTPVNPDGRFVLLATDGLPNCNGTPQTPSDSQTIAAAARLSQIGIKVFVIGFGDIASANPALLQQIAQAGGTGDFFAANSPQQLQAALRSISGTVTEASCSFELGDRPQDETKLAVTLDGAPVPRDPGHQIGWDYDAGSNTITFYGDTCARIQSGTGSNVEVDYGCGGVVIGKR